MVEKQLTSCLEMYSPVELFGVTDWTTGMCLLLCVVMEAKYEPWN